MACNQENATRVSSGNCGSAIMVDAKLVPSSVTDGNKDAIDCQQFELTAARNKETSPNEPKNETSGSFMFQRFETAGKIPDNTAKILQAAWRKKTTNKYSSCIKRFTEFCSERQTSPMHADIALILTYLTVL